jgi:CBS domain containing-hemolysin-like protein
VSTGWALLASLVLLAANAFFVGAEFALVAAKRHRLEQAAAGGSRAARAALAGSRELSMMLAGAQLGITLCTLGLGALAKPQVAHLLEPALETVGLPEQGAYVVAFLLAVAVVGFLHLVIGEMVPKSWAISHPEDSALLLALPFRAFTRVARPALTVLNGLANACLRTVGVQPQDELAQAHGPHELRMLLEASREHGTLDQPEHQLLTAMLAIADTTVAQVMTPADRIVTVAASATARDIERTCLATGRSRLAVLATDGAEGGIHGGAVAGIVHLRDATRATTEGRATTAADLMTSPFRLPDHTPVAAAVRVMREHRTQLAVATDESGGTTGLVALEDLLEELIGEFDDETDAVPTAIRHLAKDQQHTQDAPGGLDSQRTRPVSS